MKSILARRVMLVICCDNAKGNAHNNYDDIMPLIMLTLLHNASLKVGKVDLSGIHRSFFAMRHAMRRDLRWMRAMRTREIPFTEEVNDATKFC